MASLQDLIVRVGVEGIPAFKNAFKDAIEALETTGDRASKAGGAISRAFSNLGIQDSSAKVATEAKRLQQSFELLERAFKEGKISAADFAKANEGLKTSLERLGTPTQTLTEKLDRLGKTGDALKNVGGALTAAISLPIAGAAIAVTKFAADFELAMRQVTSLLGKDAAASFKPLSDGVLELSKRLGIDAVGAAQALYEAISAGVPKDNVLAFIEVASKAAIAGVTQTKVAVDGMTTIMNSYRLEASKAAEVSDAMFQAVNLGKFTFEQLAASMSVAAPVAAQVGVGFKDLLAAAATLTSKGVPVSEAMTQIAAAMRSIIAPSKEMEALFAKIGVSSGEALIKSKGLQGALEAVRAAAGGSSEVLSKATGRIEGFNAILSLTGDNAKKAREDLKSLNESVGATDAAFAEIEKSFSRQLDAFTAQAKALGIELGTALLPFAKSALEAIKPLIGLVGDLAKTFQELPSPIQLAIGGFVSLAAVAGPLLLVLGQMATSVSGLATAFKAMGGIGSIAGSFQSIGVAASAASVGVAALFGAVVIASVLQTMDAIDKLRQRYKDLADDLERKRTGKQDLIAGGNDNGKSLNALAAEQAKAAAALQEPKQGQKIDLKAIATELDIFGTAAKNATKPAEELVVAHGKMGKAAKETAADHKLARNAIKEFADGIPVAIVREYEAKVKALKTAIARTAIELTIAKNAGKDWDSQLESNIASAQALSAELLKSANSALPAYVVGLGKIKGATSGLTDDLKEAVKVGRAQFGDIRDAFKAFGFSEQELTSAAEMEKLWKLLADNVGKFKDGRLITQGMVDIAEVMGLKKAIEEQRALGNATDEYEAKLAKVQLRINAIRSDNDAYKVAGLETLESLAAQAELTAKAYEIIATTGKDSAVRVLQAQQKALEAQREVAIATGQAWDGIDDQLSRVADRLARATSLKGVSDLQAAFNTFATNAGAAITKSFGDAFDALIKGDFKGVGKAFGAMWKGVAESAVKSFTDPLKNALADFFGKTVRDLLKGSLSGVKEDIKDIASVIKGLLGITSTATSAVSAVSAGANVANTAANVGDLGAAAVNAGSAAAGAAGSAASSIASSSITSIVGAVSGVVSAVSGVVSNFQFSAMNKSLDIIVKHTLQTANDLANLRADSWTREGHLMAKLDDLFQFTWRKFDDLINAVRSISLTGATAGEGGELTGIGPLVSAISDSATRIVDAIAGLGKATGAASDTTQTVVLSSVQEMTDFLAKLTKDQAAAFEALPPELKEAINAGKLADLVNGQDQAIKDALAGYLKITNELKQVRDAVNALKPAATSATSNPASSFDTSAVRTFINPTNGGFDTSSVLAGLAAFSDRMAAYWDRLFEVLAGSVVQATASTAKTVTATEAVAQATESAAATVAQSTAETTQAVGFTTAAVQYAAAQTAAVVRDAVGFTAQPEKYAAIAAKAQSAPVNFQATAYVPPDYSSSYINTVPRSTVGASPELTGSLLPSPMDWQNTRAPQVSNWTSAPAGPASGGGYPMPAQIPIQVAIDGKVIAERMAVYYEQLGYR